MPTHPADFRRYTARVVVSSTSKDLADYRKAVNDAIWRHDMHPVAMERDTATDADAVEYSLKLVDEADIYIGIFAHRYGYIPPGSDQSITEMEYRRAVERGIPRLLFLISDEQPVKPADIEKGPGAEKLEKLKEELKTSRVVGFFTTPQNLGALVFQALSAPELLAGLPGSVPPADLHHPAVKLIPDPPTPYLAHPYIMPTDFFGRVNELGKLDEWAASADNTMVVEAIGGVGKSALTWNWLCTGRAEKTISGMAGAVWWSFYESDATMSRFIRNTLAYLTHRHPDDLNPMRRDDQEAALLAELKARPVLLVLDGIERILVAYHRMDAPHLLDDQVESGGKADEATPAEKTHLRCCTDPRDGEFLQKLLTCAPSRILISTRLVPHDLEDRHTSQRLPGVGYLLLNGLHADDALSLIRHLGVKGEADDLKEFMGQFGYHSLLINAVAGRITNYHPAPGDFTAWYAGEGHDLRLADLDLVHKRTHIMQYALAGLKPELRVLLGQVAAFRYPVDYAALAALNPYLSNMPRPEKPEEPFDLYMARMRLRIADVGEKLAKRQQELEAAEQKFMQSTEWQTYQQAQRDYDNSPEVRAAPGRFHAGLGELEDRGLLRWDRTANRYDLHPVVRAYAFEGLDADRRSATYERIRSHFEGLPPENLDAVQEVADLRRSLEIYHALLNAGRLDDAARLYGDRLEDILLYNLAAYHLVVELLEPLFPEGTDRLPRLSSLAQQNLRVINLASAYYYLGQNDKSLMLKGLQLKLSLDQKDVGNLNVGLLNYAVSLRDEDRLAAAQRTYELARDLAEAAGDTNGLAMSHLYLLGIYGDTGQWDAAEAAYAAFSAHPPTTQRTYWQAAAEHWHAETLIYRGLDASAALERAEELSRQSRRALGLRQLHGLRGEVALQRGDYDAAAECFQNQIMLEQKAGDPSVQVALGGLARARALQGRHAEARRLVEQGVEDIDAAEVWMMLGEHDLAQGCGLAAYEWAWADGPPFVWWRNLERAKKVLAALNVAPPDLPPFDPARVEKIPYEDEIRAWIDELRAGKGDDVK